MFFCLIYYNMLFGWNMKENFGFVKLFRWKNVATVMAAWNVQFLEIPGIFTEIFREEQRVRRKYVTTLVPPSLLKWATHCEFLLKKIFSNLLICCSTTTKKPYVFGSVPPITLLPYPNWKKWCTFVMGKSFKGSD